MSRLTVLLIENSPQFLNVLRDRELDLRGNNITMIENLGATKDAFDTIDLSDNRIHHLDGFPLLKRLKNIYVSNNRINYINADLARNLPELESLVFTNNNFTDFSQIEPLKHFKNLKYLILESNPVQRKINYRSYVIHLCPNLKYLDSQKVKLQEREDARKRYMSPTDPKRLLFVPGEGVKDIGTKKRKKKKGLNEREKQVIRAALDNAKTIEEVNRYEQALMEGIIPEELKGKL